MTTTTTQGDKKPVRPFCACGDEKVWQGDPCMGEIGYECANENCRFYRSLSNATTAPNAKGEVQ